MEVINYGKAASVPCRLELAVRKINGFAATRTADATEVRRAVQTLEPNMTELIGNSLYAARTGAVLIGVFGMLALLLAAVGLTV